MGWEELEVEVVKAKYSVPLAVARITPGAILDLGCGEADHEVCLN